MKKAAIPAVHTGNATLDQALAAVKQNMDQMTGQTREAQKLAPLAPNATLAQVIDRLNEITIRLQ